MNTSFRYYRAEVNGELYQIVKEIPIESKPILDKWLSYLSCDKVFTKDNNYYFMRRIDDAEIVIDDYEEEE